MGKKRKKENPLSHLFIVKIYPILDICVLQMCVNLCKLESGVWNSDSRVNLRDTASFKRRAL